MKKVNNKKGFTLAELLVVIAILAILIAIAVPIFGGALDNARETARNANVRTIKSAAMVKILDEGIAEGTWGWEATATITAEGDITWAATDPVKAANSAVTDSLPANNAVEGTYTVGIQPMD